MLLFNDEFHFKRRVSNLFDNNSDDDDQLSVEDLLNDDYDSNNNDNSDALLLIEGGYKVLDESVSMFKECEVFEAYYNVQYYQLYYLLFDRNHK